MPTTPAGSSAPIRGRLATVATGPTGRSAVSARATSRHSGCAKCGLPLPARTNPGAVSPGVSRRGARSHCTKADVGPAGHARIGVAIRSGARRGGIVAGCPRTTVRACPPGTALPEQRAAIAAATAATAGASGGAVSDGSRRRVCAGDTVAAGTAIADEPSTAAIAPVAAGSRSISTGTAVAVELPAVAAVPAGGCRSGPVADDQSAVLDETALVTEAGHTVLAVCTPLAVTTVPAP